MRDTFSKTLYDIAKAENNIFIIVADISPAASMVPYRREFPERFINVGVSEQSMISLCTGLAIRGCRPFAYTIATFTIFRPFEHIRVELCYQNLPVTLVGVGAGVAYSVAGATHNAIEDVAVMSALPNMTVIAPCDPLELANAVWATLSLDGPAYLRIGKAGEPVLSEHAPEKFEFGKIRKIKKGQGRCILGYGPILSIAFDAAERLKEETGEEVAIYSVHTLKPLDIKGISQVLSAFDQVVVLEEHVPNGSLGRQVKQIAWDYGVKCEIKTICLLDQFIHCYGTRDELLSAHGIDTESVLSLLK